MGIKLLKRMMKVRKFRPKFAAPPSDTAQRGRTRKGKSTKRGGTKRLNQFKQTGNMCRKGKEKEINNARSSPPSNGHRFHNVTRVPLNVVQTLCH